MTKKCGMHETRHDPISASKAHTLFIFASVFALFLLFPINTFGDDFITAVMAGDLNKVKEFVSNGADVNFKQGYGGFTPLMWASRMGHKEIMDFLISKGAEINVKDTDEVEGGRTSLMQATSFRRKDAVDLLISRGADINAKSSRAGLTALMYAINEHNKEIAELLVLRGADVDIRDNSRNTALMSALNHDLPEIAELLIKNGANVNASNNAGTTPIIFASSDGYKNVVELLLSRDADIKHKDNRNTTAFIAALTNGRIELADFLLTKGADISDINLKVDDGRLPLMGASWKGQKLVAEYLINKGANINGRDYDGRTPLMYTVMYGIRNMAIDAEGNLPQEYYNDLASRKEVARLLIAKGSDINAKDYYGRTAFIYATENDLYEIAKLLISNGADLKVKDDNGNNAFTYASKNIEMKNLIIDNLKIKRYVKKPQKSDGAFKINNKESQQVKVTLTNYFNYLHDKEYEKAVLLFEPLQGEHNNSWEGLASFSDRENRDDKGKVLARYCEAVGTCHRVNILDLKKVDAMRYRLKVQFIMDNGKIFALGSCCGAPEDDMLPSREFVYFVDNIGGVYKVRTPPVYVP